MASLLAHIHAGTLPFPPPPPPPHAFNPAVPHPPLPVPPALPLQTSVTQHQPLHRSNLPAHMDLDREEGEVSDATQEAAAAFSPPTSVPKKRKLRASTMARRVTSQPGAPSAPADDKSHVSLRQKKDAVLPFIAALHQEGFSFTEFLREGFDESLLRDVYHELHIPIRLAVSGQQATAPNPSQQSVVAEPSTQTQPPAAIPVREVKPPAPAKPAAPLSRQDYLARLQAAKTKKADAAVANQPVQSQTAITPSNAAQEPATLQAKVPAASASQSNAAENGSVRAVTAQNKQSQTTELIRKKMEALKATQRRLASGNSSSASTPSLPIQSQLSDHVHHQGQAQTPLNRPIDTAASPSLGQHGSANFIPGLRMSQPAANAPKPESQPTRPVSSFPTTSTSTSKSATPQPNSVVSVSVNRKRPVASDLNELQSSAEPRPFKRPFGQSRQNSFDGGMIIQVSDDEDASDKEDELSNSKPAAQAPTISTVQRDRNIRELPPLRDFPQRSTFNKQPGIVTTPLGTPGPSSDAEELRRKELEIISLNQKIKEHEKRKAAIRAKAQIVQTQSQTSSRAMSVLEKAATPIVGQDKALSAITSRPNQSTDRRTELKAALTARDADIINQKARITEMQRQIAEMQRQYEEDMENQQRLREELESLDVNTEGMTQSEMEAKKQEIDDMLEGEGIDKTASTTPDSAVPHDVNQGVAVSFNNSTDTANQHDKADIYEVSASGSVQDAAKGNKAEALPEPLPLAFVHETESSPGRATVLDNLHADRSRASEAGNRSSNSDFGSDEGSSMSESSESGDEIDGMAHAVVPTSGDVPTPASIKSQSEVGTSLSKSASLEPQAAGPGGELVWLHLGNLPWIINQEDIRSFFGAFDV